MFLNVLGDVPVGQPRADDGKREQRLRNPEERYDVRMRYVLPRYEFVVEPLIGIRLSLYLVGMENCHTPV